MDLSRYLGLFLSEAREHLDESALLLDTLSDVTEPRADQLRALFRHVHSVKGMASTMGYARLATLAHALEDGLDAVRENPPTMMTPRTTELLWASFACMRRVVDAIAAGRSAHDGQVEPLCGRLRRLAGIDEPVRPDATLSPRPHAPEPTGARLALELDVLEERDGAQGVLSLIASIGRLGDVERILPPVVVGRDRDPRGRRLSAVVRTTRPPDEVRSQFAAVAGVVDVRIQTLPGDRPRKRSTPPAPIAQLRLRADVADDLMALAAELTMAQDGLLGTMSVELDPDSRREARRCQALARRLLTAVSEIRLVPFDTATPRLVAGVEDAARRLGKNVRIKVEGGDVRIDRSVLEAIVEPLMHVARNAIAHGIESIEDRIDAGKTAPGSIRLAVVRTRDRIQVEIEDDGRGMDPAAIRDAAIRSGAITARDAAMLGTERTLELVTLPGISTASNVGQVAGRGVGLDVVARAVLDLGGRLRIRSEPGRGSSFVLDLPQTQAVIPALLCRASGDLYALPIDAIARTVSLAGAAVRPFESGFELVEHDCSWPLRPLASRLGTATSWTVPPRSAAALILGRGEQSSAIVVEEVLARQDILVRPLEAPLRALPCFTGSTVLDDGSVALVVDPTVLA